MGVSRRPSLTEWSLFSIAWQSSVWIGWGIVATAIVVWHDQLANMDVAFWVISALVIIGELRPVLTAGDYDPNGVVTSTAFVFAILYVWGFWPAVLLQASATLVSELAKRKPLWKTAFNVGQYSICLLMAWTVMALAGLPEGIQGRQPQALVWTDALWIVLGWIVWFVVNNALVSCMMADIGLSWREGFFDELGYYIVTSFAVYALAPLVAIVAVSAVFFIPLLLAPMFAVLQAGRISLDKEHQAHHDNLTGLPNRKLLVKRLNDAVDDSQRGGEPFALFLLDLDRFKEVNDTLGHHVGDDLLRLVAARIQQALRPNDVVARLGGDEFAVLLPSVSDETSATEIADRIRTSLVEPFALDDVLLELEASIGVALHPEHGSDVEQLMRRADVAMYLAKEAHSGVEVYDTTRDLNSTDRLGLLAALRHAIDAHQLELHYQPKVAMPNGNVVGFEALVRWNHPERGMVAPDEFIPLAETSGLMHRLTAYVIDTALAQAAEWRAEGFDVPVAVNVSARDLHGTELTRVVAGGLRRHRLPASSISLELTERVLMGESPRVGETLAGLERLQVSLSLDDFGTGYHSMVMLKRLPVSEIKVDRSFVSRLATAEDDASIVRSIIELAHALGLQAVAEGVETEETWAKLETLGCDSVQGWYVSRPMPADSATDWLRQNTGRARDLTLVVSAAEADSA